MKTDRAFQLTFISEQIRGGAQLKKKDSTFVCLDSDIFFCDVKWKLWRFEDTRGQKSKVMTIRGAFLPGIHKQKP